MSAERNGPSFQENVFGFRNESFRNYMTLRSHRDISASGMYGLYERMAPSDVPIVVYAAGWALTELATRNDTRFPPGWRDQAVDETARLWANALRYNDQQLTDAKTSGDYRRMQEQFGLELQILSSQMHLPAIRAVGRREETGKPQPELAAETQVNVMQFSDWLLSHPGNNKGNLYSDLITRATNTTLVSSLLYRAQPEDLLVTPSSVRQQGRRTSSKRADIIIHDFDTDFNRKIPVQVISKKHNTEPQLGAILPVYVDRDLSLGGESSGTSVLDFVVKEYKGENSLNGRPKDVDEMTAWLMNKISLHRYFDPTIRA